MICEPGDRVAYWWSTPDRLSRGIVLSVDRNNGTHRIECQRKKQWEQARPEKRRQVHTVPHGQIMEILGRPW